jgi:DNA-binding protein HU-beta
MSNITKSDLVTHVAAHAKLSSSDAEKAVTAFLDAITTTLKKGDEIRLTGFGTFSVQSVAARTGRNPRTGEEIQIKASKKPVFKAGKTLKDTLNI